MRQIWHFGRNIVKQLSGTNKAESALNGLTTLILQARTKNDIKIHFIIDVQPPASALSG
jgi:hypothetical protein